VSAPLPPEEGGAVEATPRSLPLRLPVFPVRWTYVIFAANLLVFGLSMLNWRTVFGYGALVPLLVLRYGEWWRIVTTAFIHSGLTHIAFNMYALYVLGREVERLFGGRRFLLIYALSLLGGSLFVVCFAPMRSATVGASGAILGLMGAMIAYLARYRNRMTNARREMWNLVGWAALNLVIGLMPDVSLWGHLGGLLYGLAAGWALTPRYRLEPLPHVHLVIEPVDRTARLTLLALLGVGFLLLGGAFFLR